MSAEALPIEAALPELLGALERSSAAVLAAPPGAGKTTRVPLALLDAPWAQSEDRRRIVMLEPRRIAARAAAERMAETLGERPGGRVGFRIRGENKTGPGTRVEVITEGILTRMLQSDPELSGIAAVIFDEVHERSIHTDLGLALTREAQQALRPDLRILAMSATLDTNRFSDLLGAAPVIESAGRMYPVETRWLDAPWTAGRGRTRLEDAAADLVIRALGEAEGDALVFLPGAGEIRRVAERLGPRLPGVALCPLYGALPFPHQRAALLPDAKGRRRVVLATAIAETSLTVAGVRIVVDAGRARRARVHPARGMSRLVTVPVSRAEADQRRGRAGRTAPGVCFRMWTKGEEGALPAEAPAEILEADLAPLALELALWGAEPETLAFLDPPPAPALAEARDLLASLGALDAAGRITAHGRAMAERPLHPRLSHMLIGAEAASEGPEAALLAALLADRDPLLAAGGGRAPADLGLRLLGLAAPDALEAQTPHRIDRAAAERIRAEARRLARHPPNGKPWDRPAAERAREAAGRLLACAYPDRVALRRSGTAPRFLLASGRGAELDAADPLAGQRLIVAAEVEDAGRDATIRLAAPLAEAELRAVHGDRIAWQETAAWSRRTNRVEARRQERFGAIALADQHWRDVPADALGAALAEGIAERGLDALPWSAGARNLRARVAWLRAAGGTLAQSLPDWSDAGLLATLGDWLAPHLAGMRRIEETAALDLHQILRAGLDWDLAQAIDRAAPAKFTTPLGSAAPIDYARAAPTLRVRVQEMFGVTEHPMAGDPPMPLVVELLSPAGRPVQTTRDLPGFWESSYRDVQKDMRAQFPKHPWPDDPASAAPTRRAKSRVR